MDIELEKLKKLEHALCDAIDILRDWQVEEAKPEEEKWIAYLAMPNGNGCYLTACAEDAWNEVKQIFGAKTKLFVGTKSEVEVWYKARQKFTDVIKAWEDGKTIQIYETLFKRWVDCAGTLEWYTDCKYRVKPECPCEDGIDSKACVGCEHSEDGKPEYKPYKSVEEFIQDYQERFPTAVPRPAHTMPLIWVRLKVDKRERLIVAFGKGFGTDFVEIGNKAKAVPLQKLFDDYEFLDGSPVGMEVKE